MRSILTVSVVCLIGSWLLALAAPAAAATYTLNPGQDITPTINAMVAGDTLILNPGNYSKTIRIFNKNGNPNAWFTLRGSDAGTARILATGYNNMVETYNSSYWRIENLEIDGRNAGGIRTASDGFKGKVNSSSNDDYYHHFVFDGLYIHHLINNCFSSHVTGWDITIRNCHFADAQDVGLYIGNSTGYQPMMNFTFEHNLVEQTGNYNMEVKAQEPRVGVALGITPGLEFTTWGWLIKDNVWMRDNATADENRPNLLVDAAPMSGVGVTDIATIEGNVVLGNATNAFVEHGFQLAGNLIVRNNIIMNIEGSGYAGIRIGLHQGIYPRHLEMVNNTVFLLDGASDARCLSLFDLQPGYTQVIANNAFIRGDTGHVAVSGSVPVGAIVTNNIVRGTGAIAGMTTITTPLSQIFLNPVETPGLADLYPAAGSPLIGAGANAYAPAIDFNGISRPRNGTVEVGAYEVYGATNPGWQLDIGLKEFWLYGDTDGDGGVTIFDVITVINAFGTSAGDPDWDTTADLDGNGIVDIFDVIDVITNFGAGT